MADRLQIRRDTAANWTSANPTLAQGEWGYELDQNQLKIGDGILDWINLPYFAGGGSGYVVKDPFNYSGSSTFTLSETPSDIISVSLNGQELANDGIAYTLSGDDVTLSYDLEVDDFIQVVYTVGTIGGSAVTTAQAESIFDTRLNIQKDQSGGIAANDTAILSVDSIADMATTPRRNRTRLYVNDLERGGVFSYEPSGFTVDNGIVFAANGGGFWVRNYEGPVVLDWFGETIGKTEIETALAAYKNAVLSKPSYSFNFTIDIESEASISGVDGRETVVAFTGNLFNVLAPFGLRNLSFSGGTAVVSIETLADAQFIENLSLSNLKFNNVQFPVRMRNNPENSGLINASISGLKMFNFVRGIELGGKCSNTLISKVVADGGTFAGIVVGANDIAMQDDTKNTVVSDCIITNINGGAHGVQGILVYGVDSIVTDNVVENITNTVFTDCEGIYVKLKRGVVSNNILRNAGFSEGAIDVKGTFRDEIGGGPKGNSIVVSNNQIFFDSDLTEDRLGITIAAEDVIVEANIIEGSTAAAIKTRGSVICRNVKIRGNEVRNCDATSAARSKIIDLIYIGANLEFSGNTIDGCTASEIIFLENRSSDAEQKLFNVALKGNTISDCSGDAFLISPFRLNSGVAYNTFGVLKIEDNIVEGASRGLVFSSLFSSSAVDHLSITGNSLLPSANPILNYSTVRNVSAAFQIANNLGFKTEAHGQATIASGATNVNITHGLAAAPKVAFAIVFGALNGVVTLRVANMGGSTFRVDSQAAVSADTNLNWYAKYE